MIRRIPKPLQALAALLVAGLLAAPSGSLNAKEKVPAVSPDDPAFRLFQLLDNSRGGKLADFYVIADVYKDPKNPGDELQHILRAEYDKNRGFAKLNLYVRSVGKIAPEQLRAYTPKQFYEFGISDQEKYVKTEVGPLGRPGDLYLRAEEDRPLATTPVTDDARKVFEMFLTQYVIPALEKK